MAFTRRHIMGAMGAGALFGWPGAGRAATEMKLGTARLTTLSDGHLQLPRDFMLGELDPEKAEPILAEHGVTGDMVKSPCNLTLYRDGTHTVLFDAGSGSSFMPSAGEVRGALNATGLAPGDITHVLFTHGHPDHLWGVLDDFDDPLFANATYMIGQTEWAYWTDPGTVDTIGEERASFAVGAARRLAAIEDRTTLIVDGDEVLPGIMAHDTSGHTPGHMSFEIRAGSEAVMVVGDAISSGHLAFARPEWPTRADQDTETGIATRMRLLDMLATEQMPMVGFHLPEGGLGRVERADGVYRFVTEV